MKGLQNKQPKIVLGSVQVMLRAVQYVSPHYCCSQWCLVSCCYREFGGRVFNPKVLLKALPSIFEHTDKTVRAEVRNREYAFLSHLSPSFSLG